MVLFLSSHFCEYHSRKNWLELAALLRCAREALKRAHCYLDWVIYLTLIKLMCTVTRKLIVNLLARAPLPKFLTAKELIFAVIIRNHFSKLLLINQPLCQKCSGLKTPASYFRKVWASCRSGVMRRKSSTILIRQLLERGKLNSNMWIDCPLLLHMGYCIWAPRWYPFFSVMHLKRAFSMWP